MTQANKALLREMSEASSFILREAECFPILWVCIVFIKDRHWLSCNALLNEMFVSSFFAEMKFVFSDSAQIMQSLHISLLI